MRKIVTVCLITLMSLSLIGCNSKKDEPVVDEDNSPFVTEETYDGEFIDSLWTTIVDDPDFNAFSEIKALRYDEKYDYDLYFYTIDENVVEPIELYKHYIGGTQFNETFDNVQSMLIVEFTPENASKGLKKMEAFFKESARNFNINYQAQLEEWEAEGHEDILLPFYENSAYVLGDNYAIGLVHPRGQQILSKYFDNVKTLFH